MSFLTPPADEAARLEALRSFAVLDTPAEAEFDDIVALAAEICGVPIAMVTLVDAQRQWFKAKLGIETPENPRAVSFCAHALGQTGTLIVADATKDARFAQNPLVTGAPGIRFYAGAPLIAQEGAVLGTLCVIDRVPRTFAAAQEKALRLLSREVMTHLELRRRTTGLLASEARYRALFEYAPDGILIADSRSTYLDANGTMCRMLGYAREELVGLNAKDIVVPAEVPYIESALDAIRGRSDYSREWQFRRKNGSTFPAEVIATQMPDGNLLAMVRDITERKQTEVASRRLAAIVESSQDAIYSTNLGGGITSWNAGAELMLGYTAVEMIGTSVTQLIPADRLEEENLILQRLSRGEGTDLIETLRRAKDGRLVEVSIVVSPIREVRGRIVGTSRIVRDITVLKAREREIARLSRLYDARSQVNQAIVRMPTREELFRKVCQVLVERGGFDMAWIGWHVAETHRLMPVAECGDENGYLHRIEVYTDDRPEGCGPSGSACREGRPFISNDLFNDPSAQPWRAEVERRRWRAAAAFPIRLQGEVCGVLTVCADEAGFFQDEEIALIEEAAGDVSFALDNLAREEARRQAEAVAKRERLFSETILASAPGALYFYDDQGRFLRWSRNFETVTGYSGEEIARMHPLDFFAEAEKRPLQERIAEAFAKGESSIEAPFVAKDGRSTWYYFTGRRIIFDGRPCLIGMGVDISERKVAEQALRQSEGKLRALFEQAPLGIAVVDSVTGQFRSINPQYCKIVGYSEAEMLASTFQQITHPDDLPRDLANMRRLQAREVDAFQMEKRYRRKDGFLVWVSLTCVPLWNAAAGGPQHIAMVEDITARKLAENRLAESERKYRELVEHANSIILRWNAEGRITLLNEFGQRFFGYSAEEILGKHVLGTIVPITESSGRDLQRLMEQIHADPGAFEQNINENMRRSGEKVWISWTNRIVRDEQGRVIEILSIGTDITERRKAEQAVRELNASLEHRVTERTAELQTALVRAEAADRLKSAFLATMSHELRTPLNSIIGFTGTVLQGLAGPLNEEQKKQLGMVRGSARHLLELINDVLDLSKIEAGQLQVRAEPFDLRASLERTAALVKVLADKKGLLLTTAVAPGVGEILSDRRRVEQIVLNLLNNAIKFTDHGDVTLTAGLVTDFRPSPDAPPQRAVRIAVADTGIGIREEDIATIFLPFRQVDSGLSRLHEGTGLGLVICRRLATLLGGEISVGSEWARGSEFTFTLPLQKTTAP
jgi:PAS domain S-box-containing protein